MPGISHYYKTHPEAAVTPESPVITAVTEAPTATPPPRIDQAKLAELVEVLNSARGELRAAIGTLFTDQPKQSESATDSQSEKDAAIIEAADISDPNARQRLAGALRRALENRSEID